MITDQSFDIVDFIRKHVSPLEAFRELAKNAKDIPTNSRAEVMLALNEYARNEDPSLLGSQANKLAFKEYNEIIDKLNKEWKINMHLRSKNKDTLEDSGFSSKIESYSEAPDMNFITASPEEMILNQGSKLLCELLKTLMVSESSMAVLNRENAAEITLTFLRLIGKIMYDPETKNEYYFYRRYAQLFLVKDEEFQAWLSDISGVNTANPMFRYILKGIITYSSANSDRFKPHIFSFYSEAKKALYFNHQPNTVMKITKDRIQTVPNGTDGVYFIWDDMLTPSRPVVEERAKCSIKKHIVSHLSLDFSKPNMEKLAETIIKVILLAILFAEIINGLPIIIFKGPVGSGKTTSAWSIGGALFGERFEVVGYRQDKEDGVIVYLLRTRYGVIDNVSHDPGINSKGWLNDLLARTSTRQRIPMRKLYTTADMISPVLNSVVAVTTVSGEFSKKDVLDRALIFPTIRPDNFVDENLIRAEVLENRDEILGELLILSQTLLGNTRDTKRIVSPVRMAGFYNFAVKTGVTDPLAMDEALRVFSYNGSQEKLDSRVLNFFQELINENGQSNFDSKEITSPYYTTTEIFERMKKYEKKGRIIFGQKNPVSLGKWISQNEMVLEESGIRVQEKNSKRGKLRRFISDMKD